ncbi:hypothetical protein L1987_84441 [Smallanthus sonchifolius]|uniref:Uncharacterized protein n=1 Tax=Smallanthus sonchifolius TaxID=185202 RepID=A0ACB8YET2_9ASTR|nr:hypothetical protein L1987_84441 [Smallanthus sonchifolius]
MKFMASLNCFDDEEETMLGDTTNRFLCLQELNIYKCSSLVSLPSNLPKLKVLELESCRGLHDLRCCELPELELMTKMSKLELSGGGGGGGGGDDDDDDE